MAGKKVVLGITGSIAAYKSCEIINALRKSGHEVKVIMSPSAKHFITPITLETLSSNKVVLDMFELPDKREVCHTSLAAWADLMLIAPASADMISKLASGLADCIISATILATKAKILIAPAMNDNMYKHAIIQENIKKLKKIGYEFIGPKRGHLACGYNAIGHIADLKDILIAAKKLLK